MAADGTLIFDTELNNDGVSNGIKSIEGSFGSAASLAAKASGIITTAFTTASAAAVKVGMDFQASMSQVAATMGITADTQAYETLEAAAKEMGETTQFSASQAAEALNYLALAGYDAEKAVSALPTVLNVAAAGGMDLAAASDMITDAMSALGLATDEMSTFADRLAVTSQKSNTSVAQLGEAILTVGGTAKTLSGGVTEMNTALGVLADNGIKGAEGGTALRNVILSLSAPTDKASAALEELNVNAFDATGTMRPLQDTFADLNAALSKLSDQEKTATLNEIFNKVDLKSVNALLGTSAERFEELSGYIAECEGAAADMAATMNDNLKGDLTIMGSALEAAGNAAHEKFEQPLRTAVQGVTESIGELTASLTNGELSTSFGHVAAGMSELAGSALELVAEDVLPAAINGLAWIVDNGQEIVTVVGMVAAGIAAYKVATEGAAIAQAGLNAVMNLNPLFLLASAAAAATVAVVSYINAANKKMELANNVNEATQAIYDQKAAFDSLVETADENIKESEKNAEAAKKYWQEVKNLADENGKAKTSVSDLETAVERLNEVAGTNIQVIDGQIQGYRELSAAIEDNIEKSRIAAQKSYLQESYGEALVNIGDVKTQYDEITKLQEEAVTEWYRLRDEYAKKEAEYNDVLSYGGYAGDLYQDLEDRKKIINELGDDISNYGLQIAALNEQEKAYQDTIDKYEGLKVEETRYNPDAGEEYAANYKKKMEQLTTETAETQKELTEKLKNSWENLEHDYAIGSIASEAELYAKKKALWNEYGDASLKDHWTYLEDIAGYDKDFAEEQQKAAEKAAAERLKLEEEESKKAEEERKKSISEQEKIVDNGLSKIVKAYQNAYDELDKKREAYKQKLLSIGGDLFSVNEIENPDGTKTTEYAVNNIDEQLRKMREYHVAVSNLKKEGASEGLLSELTSLNDEDSMQFAKYLSGMSATEFAKINELYNEKQRLSDELSQDLYKDDAQLISDSYTDALSALATSSYEYGVQSAQEFSKGFTDAMGELGVSSLYNQMQASGANQTYQNYWTVSEAQSNIEVEVKQGKTVLMLDGKAIGEATTEYQASQRRIKGT